MHLYSLDSTSLLTALAAEECLFDTEEMTPICLVWRSQEQGVVLGKYQDLYKEVNIPYALQHHIPVVRRSSGGGAVYLDAGCIAVCTIANGIADFSDEAQSLGKMLRDMGVAGVETSQRLSIYVHGNKISGSAQRVRRDRHLFHATLLHSTDTTQLTKVLTPMSTELAESLRANATAPRVAVPSVRDTVANLSSLSEIDKSTPHFLQKVVDYIAQRYNTTPLSLAQHPLMEQIAERAQQKSYEPLPTYSHCKHVG